MRMERRKERRKVGSQNIWKHPNMDRKRKGRRHGKRGSKETMGTRSNAYLIVGFLEDNNHIPRGVSGGKHEILGTGVVFDAE